MNERKYTGRGRELIKLLHRKFPEASVRNGVEVGVYRGDLSADLLHAFPYLRLSLVDTWAVPAPDSDYAATGDEASTQTQAEHDANLAATIAVTGSVGAKGRGKISRNTSAKAAGGTRGRSLDFVFIDADHSYSGVLQDCKLWWTKLKSDRGESPGGVLCGHDYLLPGVEVGKVTVTRAVNDFAEMVGMTVAVGEFAVWWLE
jgi:hypothetical protein